MEIWQSNVITGKEIEKALKGWSRWKMNTIRHRFGILPQPFVIPRLIQSKKEPWKFITRGRTVIYPTEIISYLQKIDSLKKEGLSYRQIKERDDVKRELTRLKLVKETELKIDPRLKGEGFFANFEAAKVNLKKAYQWNEDSPHVKFLDMITRECEQYRKEYYRINKQIRQQVLDECRVDGDLCEEKERIGRKLDYLYLLMDAVIKQGVKLVEAKVVTIKEWFGSIKYLRRR